MKKGTARRTARVLLFALSASVLSSAPSSSAAKKVCLSSKQLRVEAGKTKTLKVKNTKAKVKWSIISGKKYIALKKKGKQAVTIHWDSQSKGNNREEKADL